MRQPHKRVQKGFLLVDNSLRGVTTGVGILLAGVARGLGFGSETSPAPSPTLQPETAASREFSPAEYLNALLTAANEQSQRIFPRETPAKIKIGLAGITEIIKENVIGATIGGEEAVRQMAERINQIVEESPFLPIPGIGQINLSPIMAAYFRRELHHVTSPDTSGEYSIQGIAFENMGMFRKDENGMEFVVQMQTGPFAQNNTMPASTDFLCVHVLRYDPVVSVTDIAVCDENGDFSWLGREHEKAWRIKPSADSLKSAVEKTFNPHPLFEFGKPPLTQKPLKAGPQE